jgi:hypothetical protein
MAGYASMPCCAPVPTTDRTLANKSLPERSDQRLFLCVAQIIEVGELRYPAFRIDATVTVSTRLLLPSPAHCLCLTARLATRDEQRRVIDKLSI